jgi:hypothetical protein
MLNLPTTSCSLSAASRVIAHPSRNPGAPWHFDSDAQEITRWLSPTALGATGSSP